MTSKPFLSVHFPFQLQTELHLNLVIELCHGVLRNCSPGKFGSYEKDEMGKCTKDGRPFQSWIQDSFIFNKLGFPY